MRMKNRIFVIAIVSVMLSVIAINDPAQAFTQSVQFVHQSDSASFKVYGKCGMCEKRIEGAAKKLEGVESANWDVDSKILTVKYDGTKVEETNIHEKVAGAGHDTEKVEATDEAYDNLMGCCKYERSQK